MFAVPVAGGKDCSSDSAGLIAVAVAVAVTDHQKSRECNFGV